MFDWDIHFKIAEGLYYTKSASTDCCCKLNSVSHDVQRLTTVYRAPSRCCKQSVETLAVDQPSIDYLRDTYCINGHQPQQQYWKSENNEPAVYASVSLGDRKPVSTERHSPRHKIPSRVGLQCVLHTRSLSGLGSDKHLTHTKNWQCQPHIIHNKRYIDNKYIYGFLLYIYIYTYIQ